MALFDGFSALLLMPVHVAIYALFVFALFESGRTLVQWLLRFRHRHILYSFNTDHNLISVAGFPIIRHAAIAKSITVDELDLEAMRRLELIRIATRITPMLGLIATLIPMGPALVALTKNDVTQMSELLRSAFSAVVLALAASCLCFWVASVRRRWCAEEVLSLKRHLEEEARTAANDDISRRAA